MPKRIHAHNALFQQLLHARGMTLKKLAAQASPGAETHVHLCMVVNGRRAGRRTMRRLREILPEEEWKALKEFREGELGKGVDDYLESADNADSRRFNEK